MNKAKYLTYDQFMQKCSDNAQKIKSFYQQTDDQIQDFWLVQALGTDRQEEYYYDYLKYLEKKIKKQLYKVKPNEEQSEDGSANINICLSNGSIIQYNQSSQRYQQ